MSQAAAFVKERGFIYFWPIKGTDLPSLWTAVAGDRPVADEHDDPGHKTWGWKDDALDKRIWYYGKILRRKATMISLDVAPYFYALSANYGSPDEDYLIAYRDGSLTQAAKQVYEALLRTGPLNTIDLRRAARLGNARDAEFNRALESLQVDFKILPVGVAEAGAWRYAHIYDLVPRHFPELPERARAIPEPEARLQLARLYFRSVGAAQPRGVQRLLGWSAGEASKPLATLQARHEIELALYPGKPGEWLALTALCA